MRMYLSLCLSALLLLAIPAFAAVEEGNHDVTGTFTQADLVTALQNGTVNLKTARQVGLLVFSTPFNKVDGLGDGPFDLDEWNDTDNGGPIGLGHRPTLQGNGQFLRVNGLDAQSCNECHGFVSQATRPPILGLAGVGGAVQNAIIMPSMIDVADSFDNRTQYAAGHVPDLDLNVDGVADFNGRFANPPFLFGGGGVELLAKEMTYDLQQLKAAAEAAPAGAVIPLNTHGINFGYIVSQGGTNIEIHNQGINEDLVVRPFGRKGENFSMRDFDRGAMQFHFGIQPEELFGDDDADGDGVSREVTIGEMSALHIFDVSNPRPHADAADLAGPARQGRLQRHRLHHVPHAEAGHPAPPGPAVLSGDRERSDGQHLLRGRPHQGRLQPEPERPRRGRAAVFRPQAPLHGPGPRRDLRARR